LDDFAQLAEVNLEFHVLLLGQFWQGGGLEDGGGPASGGLYFTLRVICLCFVALPCTILWTYFCMFDFVFSFAGIVEGGR
jgi:hypothetical protein